MLIGGNKTTKTLFKKIEGKCPNCGNQTLGIQVYQKYGHLFWIPFIPIYKIGIMHCTHCKLALEKKEAPAELISEFDLAKKEAPIPKWTFIGLFLFVTLIVVLTVSNSNHEKEQNDLFNNPKVGDYYNGKLLFDNQYVVYKLVSIKNNEFKLLVSNYQAESLLGLTAVKSKNSYSQDTIVMDAKGFKEYKDQGLFISVIRE
jgi:hypothetical protein